MKKINTILISLLFITNLYSKQSTFLKEGNLSITGIDINIIQISKTNASNFFLGIIDNNNDDLGDGVVLIDINSTNTPNQVEITNLNFIMSDINAAYSPNATINKIIKRNGTNDEYFIMGSYDSNLANPPKYGFIFGFSYVPPSRISFLRTIASTIGKTYNITNITDLFETNITNEYIASGAIYDHIGINSYTSPVGGTIVSVNNNEELVWIALLDNTFKIKRHYINYFLGKVSAPEKHLIINSLLNRESNITAMGYVDKTNHNLLMFELNATPAPTTEHNLTEISNYKPYSRTYSSLPLGTTIDISKGGSHSGKFLDPGISGVIQYARFNATSPIPAPLAFPGPITSTTDTYTLNATANVTINYGGYVSGTSELWDFMDINCSDTLGVSRNISNVYLIPFPVSEITNTDCLPPNVNYYESDKNISEVGLQWEWIYSKNKILKWSKVFTKKTDTKFTSRMILNTNYISKDNNKTTLSVLHNTITPNNQFNIININANDGTIQADRKHPKKAKETTITKGISIVNDQDGNMIVVGKVTENNNTGPIPRTTDCIVMKIDKNGNEVWEQYLGHFQDDGCGDIIISKSSRKPTYSEYVAVGSTKSVSGGVGNTQGWAVNFRDAGILIPLHYQWNLIGNPTEKNITALGPIDNSSDIPITDLGAHKYYFAFKNNQWLLNKLPIRPLDGFFLVSLDNKQEIFLEGNLLEQKFQDIQDGETGWVLLSTGVKLVNPKIIYDLYAIYVYRNGQYQSNPIEIYPGEGFWAKKER